MRLPLLIAWGITRILGCAMFALTEPVLRANVWCKERLYEA